MEVLGGGLGVFTYCCECNVTFDLHQALIGLSYCCKHHNLIFSNPGKLQSAYLTACILLLRTLNIIKASPKDSYPVSS